MGRIAIGVWLSVALIGVLAYLLPELMKQLFFVKEQFESQKQEEKEAWRFERVSVSEPVPSYLQNPPKDLDLQAGLQVGGAGGISSQPAPINQIVSSGPTPMELQGMQMKRAPAATGPVEAFQGTAPSAAPAAAPTATPSAALAPAPSCTMQLTYNPNGAPVYTCDGKIVNKPLGEIPPLPMWLKSTTTKDGIDAEEAAILNYWLSKDKQEMPTWVRDLAVAPTLTESEKRAFATWAKEKTRDIPAIVQPTGGSSGLPTWLRGSTSRDGLDREEAAILNFWLANEKQDLPGWVKELADAPRITESEKKALASWARDNTKTSQKVVKPTTTTTTCTSKTCKPKPKPTCAPKDTKPPTEPECKGPIDLGDYIRKDSIPCWACKL